MLKKLSITAVASVMLVSLAACQNNTGPKQNIGAVGGAILGGIAGAQFGKGTGQLVATGIGASLGLLIGSEIGRNLDEVDQMKADQAFKQASAAPIGQQISWNNPESGNSGTVTPTRDGRDTGGRYCREYLTTVNIGGKQEEAYGQACRQPDGSWEIVK